MTLTYYGNDDKTYTMSKDGYTNTLSGVVANAEMPADLVDNSIFIVDLTKARISDYSQVDVDKSPNTLIKSTPLQRLSNVDNVWTDGHIASLNITDGYGMKIPSEIIADKASYQRNESDTYGTLCLPFPVYSNDDLQLFNVSSYSAEGKLIISAIEMAEAGQPVIYKKLSESPVELKADNVTLAMEAGSTTGELVLKGCYEQTTVDQNAESCYYIDDNQFLVGNTDFTVPAFWAYLDGRSADVSGISVFLIDEVATGVTSCEDHKINDAPIYNLQGIRVERPAKGVYLQGGRKYIRVR